MSKIKNIKTLVTTRFLSIYEAIYENKMGNEKTWMITSRKNETSIREQYFNGQVDKTDAVVIAALHKASGKLVLVRQFRVPLNDYVYELPAGLIDPDEEMKKTLTRELKEETGLDLIEIKVPLSHSKLYLSPGMTDESVALMYCLCEGEISKTYLEEDEDIEAVLVSPKEAEAILKGNHRLDIKAFLVLQSFVTLGTALFDKEL